MKKLLAAVLTVYIIAMGFVIVAGFIQQQAKEDDVTPRTTTTSPSSAPTTSSAPTSQPAAQASKSYTSAQVSQHSDQSSCWLIINNKVYDVTNFLSQHPGGAGTIVPYCGQEATRAFDTKDRSFGGGHSPAANSLLQDYLIGNLTP